MSLKKSLKIILVLILVIISLFMIHLVRNMIIVTSMQSKFAELSESRNYHMKVNSESDSSLKEVDYYYLDGKQAVTIVTEKDNVSSVERMYNNGKRIDTFKDIGEEKIVLLDYPKEISVNLYNGLESDSMMQTIIACMFTRISSEECNGKSCYRVVNYMSPYTLSGVDRNEVYIEKDTGLSIKIICDDQVSNREYEFDTVTEEMFIEPDIGQYTIQEVE